MQIAICTLVLIGLGLCQRNLYNLRHADVGFSARNLVAMTVYPASEGYSEARGRDLYGQIRKAAAALPGVESVTLARNLPLFGADEVPVQPPAEGKKLSIAHTVVDTSYFSTRGMAVLRGRRFNSTYRETSTKTAVINRKMAEMFWPGQDPVGKVIAAGEPANTFTIIGVAADGKYEDLDEPRRPFLYYALSQHYQPGMNVIARTAGDPGLWVKPLERAIRNLGFKAPVRPVTFERWLNLTLLTQRITAGVVAALSALGLLLEVIGLSGAISWPVSQRKKNREDGSSSGSAGRGDGSRHRNPVWRGRDRSASFAVPWNRRSRVESAGSGERGDADCFSGGHLLIGKAVDQRRPDGGGTPSLRIMASIWPPPGTPQRSSRL